MSTAYTSHPVPPANGYSTTHANVATYVNGTQQSSMDRGPSDYTQPDQASAAHYPPTQEVRPSTFSSSATPTSDYGINPSSARSSNFPEYLARQGYPDGAARYHPSPSHSGSSAGMAQASNPSIAASSPSYPPPGQYSPYPPQHEMPQAYPGPPGAPQMYGRPEWGPQYPGHQHGMPPYGHPPSSNVSAAPPTATAGPRPGQHPLSQVYSFVPIPGAQQHKRPRRRYEEIERMYKCGWNGCEKAYGTLNHLNAHVTMQSHGQKRTPEEFKEIRKEWKARKKEEENQRKAEEERQRAAAQANQVDGQNPSDGSQAPAPSNYPPGVRPQLPPIGYAPAQGNQVPSHYAANASGIEQMNQYANSQLYSNYSPSAYGQGNQMYQQHPEVPPSNYQQ